MKPDTGLKAAFDGGIPLDEHKEEAFLHSAGQILLSGSNEDQPNQPSRARWGKQVKFARQMQGRTLVMSACQGMAAGGSKPSTLTGIAEKFINDAVPWHLPKINALQATQDPLTRNKPCCRPQCNKTPCKFKEVSSKRSYSTAD